MTDTDAPRGSAPAPAPSSARSDQRGPVDLSAIPTAARERWSELVRDIEAARDALTRTSAAGPDGASWGAGRQDPGAGGSGMSGSTLRGWLG